ncbi:MAG: peptide deformylase [Chthonomonadaceae bacterium]|nr:peptide deformylase [Chthonomonadaceae bacterium]
MNAPELEQEKIEFTRDEDLLPPPELEEAWLAHPEIVKIGDPLLRKVAEPVAKIDGKTRVLIDFMEKTMRKASGLGLAAPQLGYSIRLFIYDAGDGVKVLINPVISGKRGEQIEPAEGCLSIPGLRGDVKRANELRVKAYNRHGKPFSFKAKELEARVILHEIDHLDGILFVDRVEPGTLRWGVEDDDEGEE